MSIRIGKVTKVYPAEGRVVVTFEDRESSSMPLAVLAMNHEYSMPQVGERVVTLHLDNGRSKGFVLGGYYGGGSQPRASSGYRKDFSSGVNAVCTGGAYTLSGTTLKLLGSGASVSIGSSASMVGSEAIMGSGASDDGGEPAAYVKTTADSVEIKADLITLKCSYGTITVEEMMKRLERIEDQLGLPHTI